MNTAVIAIHVLAISSFIACSGLFAFLYGTSRSTLVGKYLPYLLMGFCQELQSASMFFLFPAGDPSAISAYLPLLRYPSLPITAGLIATAPRFYAAFAGKPFGKRAITISGTVATVVLLISPLNFAPRETGVIPFIPSMVALVGFLAAIFYGQAILISAYRNIEERLFRMGIPKIIGYNVLCVLSGIFDATVMGAQMASGEKPSGILSGPILYALWNVATFVWAIRFHGTLVETTAPKFLPDPAKIAEYGLSERETELAKRLAMGLSNKEIAFKLGISPNTARNHIHNIFAKTGARSRIDLVRLLAR